MASKENKTLSFSFTGVDNTKSVVSKSKEMAVTTGSIGLGLTLVATQVFLLFLCIDDDSRRTYRWD